MTLPPCPIAGHDNPHHWHCDDGGCAETVHSWYHDSEDCADDPHCYSAHVPTEAPADLGVAADAPSPDPDEWVRVPVGTRIPAGTLLREEWHSVGSTANEDATVQIRRSDLDVILKPAPTPAERLAEALTQLVIGAEDAWLPDDVQSALDAAGLTLAERAER